MKKLLVVVPFAIILLAGMIFSGSGKPALAAGSGYDITSYKVDILVGQDNAYHVTENISVDYHEPMHGIIRYVPYRQEMKWNLDGEQRKVIYNTRISGVNVEGASFAAYKEGGNLLIRIGDAEELVTGQQNYTVTFDHFLGNDKLDAVDFVYYNIIGTDWDCSISDVSFTVTLPQAFDADQIWFYSGGYGSAEEAAVTYSVAGNTITGVLAGTLQPYQGLTLELDLPQGYFTVPEAFSWQTFLSGLAAVLLLITLFLFWRYGRDERMVAPVEFNAPDGITPAEAGYIIDTTVDNKDVVSLVMYWASGGYLAIERLDKDEFRFTKLADLPQTAAKYERTMFSDLFSGRTAVTTSELKDVFYSTVVTAKEMVIDHYGYKENRLYGNASRALGWLVRLGALILTWLALFAASYEVIYEPVVALIISVAGTLAITAPFVILAALNRRWLGIRRLQRSAKLVITVIFAALVILIFLAYLIYCGMAVAGVAVGVAVALMHIFSIFMRKRTKRGSELLGRMLGFKNFLERAEKDRIEKLVEENPNYFYDVLPYAYVLGVTDKWARNFEGMALQPPSWYRDSYGSGDVFSPMIFQAYLFHSMNTVGSAMTSRPSPEISGNSGFGGGSFGGGGGFSGGGFGGGGGRGW